MKIYKYFILLKYQNACENNEKLLNRKLDDYSQLINDLKNQLTESLSTIKKQK